MSADETARATPRAMLALVVLADVPPPTSIRWTPEGLLSMDFARVVDGQAWATFLGGRTDTYATEDGRRYLSAGIIEWRGWRVNLHVIEAVDVEQLDADTRAALTAVVEDGQVKP